MVGEYGEVLVLDWGMAKIMGREPPRKAPSEPSSPVAIEGVHVRDSNLTIGCGCILGTPSYMAPEQAANQPIDPRADIYALGGILYHILTLRPPHEEGEVYEMLEKIKTGKILPPLAHNPPPCPRGFSALFRSAAKRSISKRLPHCPSGQIPESLSMIAMKALALKPGDRYPEVRELHKDIRAYQGGFITSAETKGLYKSLKLLVRRHRVESSLIAVSLLIILFLSVAYVMGERAKRIALQARIKAEEDRRRLEEKTEAERRRDWRLVFKEDFSDPDFLSRWETNGPWKVKDGELRIGGGDQCVRLKIPMTGDVRLVFDCQKDDGELSDVSLFLGGLKTSPLANAFLKGYLFQYGGNLNRRIRLIGPKAILWSKCASPLDRGWRYHVDARKMGSRLVLMIDGQTVIDVRDERPVYGAEHAYVGFYNYRTNTRYSNVQVYTRDPALAADLLETAEDLLSRGSHVAARELFRQVLDSSRDPKRTDLAEKGFRKATRYLRLVDEFPSLKARILKAWPQAAVSLGNNGVVLNINGMEVSDLSPLRGMAISELYCGGNQIANLEPLKGMELSVLNVADNQIVSLDPLMGMPLVTLHCGMNRIRDLGALHGMNLKTLSCDFNPISSLDPLRGMKLDMLYVNNTEIKSLEPLRGMELDDLIVGGNRISSLDPLRGMSLNQLGIASLQIKDLEFLRGANVLLLSCGNNQIASLEPVRGMNLERLDCHNNRITSLEPLREMQIAGLDCRGNPLNGLEPVVQDPPREWWFDVERMSPGDRLLFKERSAQPRYAASLQNAEIRYFAKQMNRDRLLPLAKEFGGHRYLLVRMEVTWTEAEKMCEGLGGHLATITSAAENDFIRSQWDPTIDWGFIGLVFDGKQRKWVTGEPFDYNRVEGNTNNRKNAVFTGRGDWAAISSGLAAPGFVVEWDH
jgi:hypothetical protein